MKRTLSLIMVLAMVLGMIPFGVLAAAAGTAEDPIIITQNSNYTAVCTEDNLEIYYQYTATEDGTVSVNFDSENESVTSGIDVAGTVIPYIDEVDGETVTVYSVDMEVSEGDVIDIVAFDEAAAEITFYFQFTPPEGSEKNPIQILSNEPAEITVPADTTLYYHSTGNVNGMVFTLMGKDVTVAHNGTTYTAADGKVTFTCAQVSTNEAAVYAVTNLSGATATYAVTFDAPLGTNDNKAPLQLDQKTTVSLAAKSEGYYYTWTAEKAGTLSLTMNSKNWVYVMNNITAGKYGETQWSDSDPLVNPGTVAVSAGDMVELLVNTYNPSRPYEAPKGTVTFTAAFTAADSGDEGGGEEGGDTPDVGEGSNATGSVAIAQGEKITPAATWTAPADGFVTVTLTTSAATGNSYELWANDVRADEATGYTGFVGTITKTYPVVAGDVYTLNLWSWNFSTMGNNAATIDYNIAFSAEGGSGETVKEEYAESETALVVGENTLTMLDTAYSTVYRFEPTETGVYTFIANNAEAAVGIWGYNCVNGDPNAESNSCQWTCSAVNQGVYIGVSDIEGDFTLTVTKTGEATVGYETVVYENLYKDSAMPYIECLKVIESVTVGGTQKAVLGDDGYYHLDSVDGPILMLNTSDTDLSIAAAYNNSNMTGVETDEEGNTVKVIKYDNALGEYIVKSSTIVNGEVKNTYYSYVPLNGDLITIIQEVGKNPNYNWYGTNGWAGTDAEDAWLFMCVTAELKHTDENSDNTCDICSAAVNGEVGGEDECLHEYTYSCDAHCAKCGELTNPDAKHTIAAVEAVAATCYENGNIAYWYCTICGAAWADDTLTQVTNQMSVIVPMAHAEATHVEAVAPTCTEDGNIEYWYCAACGQAWLDAACTLNTNLLSVVLPAVHALEHVAAVVPANCQETGHDEYWYCSGCDAYFGDADASWQVNPAWMMYTGAHVRPEGSIVCAVVQCELCGEDAYGESCDRGDAPECQDAPCVNCGETVWGWGCNYNTGDEEVPLPLCQSGTCVYCGTQYEKLYECENGAWALCQEGECSYGCGKTYPATEEHAVEDPCVGGLCQKCWNEIEPAHQYFYACDPVCMNCYELTNPDAAHALTHVEAVEATCDENGNIEYWTCEYCGGCWNNADATGMPLNQMMVIVPAGHTDEDGDEICDNCQEDLSPEEIVPMDAPQVEVRVNEVTGAYYLTWNEDSNATIYEIYRATKKTGTYTLVDTVDGAYWEDASASVGKTYYYKVGAVNENEPGYNSQLSSPVSMTQKCVAPVVFAENNPETGRVKLSWEKVSGAKKYDVYRATSPDGKYSKLTTTSKNYYTDSKGSVGREYFYKVRAVASSSKYNSTYSFIVSGVRICAQVELSVKLDNATGKPVLSWDEVSGAASYRILRQLPGEDAFAEIAVVDDDRHTDIYAPVDTQCVYMVQAMGANEALDGAVSETATSTASLARPQLQGTLTLTGRPSISWEAVEGAQSYMIYRSTKSSKSYKQIDETADRFFTDETASGGKAYYYKVVAVGANSESAISSYKKLTGKCVAPVVTAENNEESGRVRLSWEKVSGAKKYYVYRSTSLEGKYTKLTSTTKAYYTDSKGTLGTEYFYKVVAAASSSKYNSYDSNIVSGTRVCAQPEIKVTVDKYTGKPNVSWDKVSGATGYALHMSVNGGDYELLDVITTTTSLSMGIAEAGNTYRFAIQAVVDGNEDLNSAWIVSEKVLATCGRPSITGTRSDAGKPQISWEADEEAEYYVIYRSTKSSSGYKELDTTEAVSFTDETAKAGKTYYYEVVAVAGESESYMSSYVKIKSK